MKKAATANNNKKFSNTPKKGANLSTQNGMTVPSLIRALSQEEEGEDRCLVCCEKMETCSFGECGHRSCCGLCTFRLRTLHDDERCILCKAHLDKVIIISLKETQSYSHLIQQQQLIADSQNPSILFTGECLDFKQQIDSLREFRCGECELKFPNVDILKRHLEKSHNKYLCKLCLEFRGFFLMEHKRMTLNELTLHNKEGEGHPSCKFCRGMMFYNNDQLYKHLNEKHEACHLCAKAGQKSQYFKDYSALEIHFSNDHFLCEDSRCKASRFVVFLTPYQLQAHRATEHPNKADEGPLNVEFIYKGSRRAQQVTEEEEEEDGTSSYFPRPPSPIELIRMNEDNFPRLGGGVGGSVPISTLPSRRYSQTAGGRFDAAPPSFSSLGHLAGSSAVQEVELWCKKLKERTVDVKDFYDYLFNLLGEVALNVVFPAHQLVVPKTFRCVDHVPGDIEDDPDYKTPRNAKLNSNHLPRYGALLAAQTRSIEAPSHTSQVTPCRFEEFKTKGFDYYPIKEYDYAEILSAVSWYKNRNLYYLGAPTHDEIGKLRVFTSGNPERVALHAMNNTTNYWYSDDFNE